MPDMTSISVWTATSANSKRNTLAADPDERRKWTDYAIGQLRMADEIGARCSLFAVIKKNVKLQRL